jgi:hypothetical protein
LDTMVADIGVPLPLEFVFVQRPPRQDSRAVMPNTVWSRGAPARFEIEAKRPFLYGRSAKTRPPGLPVFCEETQQ